MEFSVLPYNNVCLKVEQICYSTHRFYQINFLKYVKYRTNCYCYGLKSDWATMQETTQILDELNVAYHVEVVSTSNPRQTVWLPKMQRMVTKVDYAGAGGATHLPSMIAAKRLCPYWASC